MSTCPHPEKQRHGSVRAALKARASLEVERGVDIALRPYKCGDHWHLGHRGMKNPKVQLSKALALGRKNTKAATRSRKR